MSRVVISTDTQQAWGLSPVIGLGVMRDTIGINSNAECQLTSYIFLFFRFGVCTITNYEAEGEDFEVLEGTDFKEIFKENLDDQTS
jgi:hypothetical protein